MKLEGDHTQTPPGRAEGPREEQGWSPPNTSMRTTESGRTDTNTADTHTRKRETRAPPREPKADDTKNRHTSTQGEPHTATIHRTEQTERVSIHTGERESKGCTSRPEDTRGKVSTGKGDDTTRR